MDRTKFSDHQRWHYKTNYSELQMFYDVKTYLDNSNSIFIVCASKQTHNATATRPESLRRRNVAATPEKRLYDTADLLDQISRRRDPFNHCDGVNKKVPE